MEIRKLLVKLIYSWDYIPRKDGQKISYRLGYFGKYVMEPLFGRSNLDSYTVRLLHLIFPRTCFLMDTEEPEVDWLDETWVEKHR